MHFMKYTLQNNVFPATRVISVFFSYRFLQTCLSLVGLSLQYFPIFIWFSKVPNLSLELHIKEVFIKEKHLVYHGHSLSRSLRQNVSHTHRDTHTHTDTDRHNDTLDNVTRCCGAFLDASPSISSRLNLDT